MKKSYRNPPKIAKWLIYWSLKKENRDSVIGDFEEFYNDKLDNYGIVKAQIWFWVQSLKSFPHFLSNYLYWRTVMLENYLKITYRILIRNKVYSAINISGLSIGMTCFILIFLWVHSEVSFDRFHENIENLYLIATQDSFSRTKDPSPGTPPALGPILKDDFSEILNTTRFVNGPIRTTIRYHEKNFNEVIVAADPSVLQMFTFPLMSGSKETVLANPHSIVITKKMAKKYFGDNNPVGEVITLDNKYEFQVTGVLQDMQKNSTLNFNFLVPIEFFREYWNLDLTQWENYSFTTFALLADNTSHTDLNKLISDSIKKRNTNSTFEPSLIPASRLHLHGFGFAQGKLPQVLIFSSVAFFIIFIACVNFMNLTTARFENRAKEIAIRKISGAYKGDVRKQFYTESILLAFCALLITFILINLLIPTFNQLTNKNFTFEIINNPFLAIFLVVLTLLTGMLSGSYPALYISSIQPLKLLSGSGFSGLRRFGLREILVVIQFVISICLIIGSLIIYKQINYMNNMDLGFNKENLYYLSLNRDLKQNCEIFKNELNQNPNIKNISLVSYSPTGIFSSDRAYSWDGKFHYMDPLVTRFCTDSEFLSTFEGEMISGNYFNVPGISNKIVINEEFAKLINNENLIGFPIEKAGKKFEIAGIIKNFNFSPLYNKIQPLAIFLQTENQQLSDNRYRYIFLRIEKEKLLETINYIERIYKQFSPEYPFALQSLEDDYDRLYYSEQQEGTMMKYFTGLAIFISCVGLLGLASFSITQRSREICIRKVFGSPITSLILLISKRFVFCVFIANILAWPIAYMISKVWLNNFAYQITVDITIFIYAGLIAFLIAIFSVIFHGSKAALTNPVNALKHE